MAGDKWYNGYDGNEREKKFKALKKLVSKGELPPSAGPCMLCRDPHVATEYHDEDYSEPYIWGPPALLSLCRHCHRDKLHKRFWRHSSWFAYIAHIRRGGYASDLKDPIIKKQINACRKAIENNLSFSLPLLRPYTQTIGFEWFANLRLDPESLLDPSARPRP